MSFCQSIFERRLFPVMATALLASLASSAPSSASREARRNAPGKTHTVLIGKSSFVPARLEVKKGDRVIWKNVDLVPHTATARRVFDSKHLKQGQSWTYTATEPGTHAYLCLYHPTMLGELIVR